MRTDGRAERAVLEAFRGLDDGTWFDALGGAADQPIQTGVREGLQQTLIVMQKV